MDFVIVLLMQSATTRFFREDCISRAHIFHALRTIWMAQLPFDPVSLCLIFYRAY